MPMSTTQARAKRSVRHQTRAFFARNIHAMRKMAKLSQEKVAMMSGLHRTYVGSVERCERNISLDNTERLAKVFGLTVADMVSEHFEPHAVDVTQP